MEILSSRILLTPRNPSRTQRFYRDELGLPIYREFGDRDSPGLVFFLGGGYLEVSGRSAEPLRQVNRSPSLWIQVRDVAAEYERLSGLGVDITRRPLVEPWGLIEMWIADPDGVRIVVVQIPQDHPLRRDNR